MRVNRALEILLLALMGISVAGVARAQGPDVRGTKPLLMLVVDSSGSMEWLPGCTCTTDACNDCLPDCEDDSGTDEMSRWSTALEALTGTFPSPFQCEAYERDDSSEFVFDYGYLYPYHQPWECNPAMSGPCNSTAVQNEDGLLDTYKTEVRFGLMTFDSQPTYVGADEQISKDVFNRDKSDSEDGLWSYGLGESTPANPRLRDDNTRVGLLHFPNCTESFLIDTGARNDTATQGGLISAISTQSMESTNEQIQNALLATRPYGGTPMAAAMDDLHFYFEELDDSYSSCRDTYAILITDGLPDDDYRAQSGCDCKDREECCQAYLGLDSCDGIADLATNPDYTPSLYQCPYPTPEEVADALVNGYDDGGGVVKRCWVVGFATPCNDSDPDDLETPYDPSHETEGCKVRDRLDAIAAACSRDGLGTAVFADSLSVLRDTIDNILTEVSSGAVSRTVPAFLNTSNTSGLAQYQFNTGFNVGSESEAWSGVLERTVYQCNSGTIDEIDPSEAAENRFHETLNANDDRKLWTALPDSDGPLCNSLDCTPRDHLYRFSPSGNCGSTFDGYCDRVVFENPTNVFQENGVLREHLELEINSAGLQRRYEIMKWVHADDSVTDRANNKLGDIYHSSPAVVGKPSFRLSDDEYNQFRYKKAVATRPPTLYVGTNDGILHAFSVDQYPAQGDAQTDMAHQTVSYAAGEEMWGFVPPFLLHKLDAASTMHTFMVDGTPVVKDVPLSRVPDRVSCQNSAGDTDPFCNYRTVLIAGLRGGGSAYFALDITDPVYDPNDTLGTDGEGNSIPGPRFLWQFTHEDLGETYGRPALGQAVIRWNPTTSQPDSSAAGVLMERAIAILPGGKGVEIPGSSCLQMTNANDANGPYKTQTSTIDSQVHEHRPQVRCWEAKGRSVFIVDVETGVLIKQIDESVFRSPIVGTPALFQGDVGTLATRAFVADADGVLWRIDLSRIDPVPGDPLDGWTARPFHDAYWQYKGAAYTEGYKIGQASYESPVLSVDTQGRVVVLFATGDTEDFEDTEALNYVVSLTELNVPGEVMTQDALDDVKAAFNWEIKLQPSELVTGSLELFNRRVYFASFVVSPSYDPCDYGYSRLFAVDYINRDLTRDWPGTSPLTYYPELVASSYLGSAAALFNNEPGAIDTSMENKLYMGVGITRRPQCFSSGTDTFDDIYGQLGGLAGASSTANATYELVGMVSGEQVAGSELGSVRIEQSGPEQMNSIEAFAGTCE